MALPKVCIDPGHGANDPGTVSGKRMEKTDNLALGLELERQFAAQGWQTVLTRNDDSRIILAHRTSLANSEKCDLYLSVHRNGFVSASANGAEIWLHSQASERYKGWAADILAQLAALGFANRGVKLGHVSGSGEYAVNRDTVMPSMLLELGFVTNERDNTLFDSKQKQICTAIVRSSSKFLDYAYNENPNPVQPPEGKTYTLNVTKLREQGFSAIEITL